MRPDLPRRSILGLALLFASGAATARAEQPAADPLGWFGELAGSCWVGSDASGRPTERQCYRRQYGRFVRGTIEISAASASGERAFAGDSLFVWNAEGARIDYDFWASSGGFGRGTARWEGAQLVFPPADGGEPDRPRLRARWERLDAGAFRVLRERAEGDHWRALPAVTYRRDGEAGEAPARAEPPAPGGPLAAFAFLADSCWVGTFANGRTRDENCFEWTLGGQFLRSRHRVVNGEEPYEGETLFGHDPRAGRAFFVYWNSAGGVIRGFATPGAAGIDFPDERVEMGGESFTLRSSWRREGDDRFTALTEREQDGVWSPMLRIEFVRAVSR
jgi:hypothetical protein